MWPVVEDQEWQSARWKTRARFQSSQFLIVLNIFGQETGRWWSKEFWIHFWINNFQFGYSENFNSFLKNKVFFNGQNGYSQTQQKGEGCVVLLVLHKLFHYIETTSKIFPLYQIGQHYVFFIWTTNYSVSLPPQYFDTLGLLSQSFVVSFIQYHSYVWFPSSILPFFKIYYSGQRES